MKTFSEISDPKVIKVITKYYPTALIFRNEEVENISDPHFVITVEGISPLRKLGALYEGVVSYDLIYAEPEAKGTARKLREKLLDVYGSIMLPLKGVGAQALNIEIETETRRIHIRFDMYVYAEEVRE